MKGPGPPQNLLQGSPSISTRPLRALDLDERELPSNASPNPHEGARLQLLRPKTQQALLQLPCTPRGGSFQNRT